MAVTKVNDWTWTSDLIPDTKFKTKRDAYAAEADLEAAPPAAPVLTRTANATAARRLDPTKCSGKWSRCGGKGTRKSASWGLCQDCTDARKSAKAQA